MGYTVKERVVHRLTAELTTDEVAERSDLAAHLVEEIVRLKNEAKATARQAKEEVSEREEELLTLAHQVSSHTEVRPVECEVRHDIERGTEETVRLDTGALIGRRALLPRERQGQMFPLRASDDEEEPGASGVN